MPEFFALPLVQILTVLVRIRYDFLLDPRLDDFDAVILEVNDRRIVLLRLHFLHPWSESVLTIGIIDNCCVQSLPHVLFVHPVVLDTSLNVPRINYFAELFHLLQLIFAEDTEES